MVRRRPRSLVAAALLGASPLLEAGSATANGRFPSSNGVIVSPTDDATVLVRATFGLLVTHDRGRSWGWICERAIGVVGPEDPSYLITKSGAIVAGMFEGLRVSRDGGCSWEKLKIDATVFVDVTLRSDGAILTLASAYDRHGDAGSLYKTQLWISTDDARSFVALGTPFEPTLLGESVEVAPSDPSRIYVSAVRGEDVAREGVFLVSTDGGKHFTERPTKLENRELASFIAAVDPKRAQRIYLRTSGSAENPTRLLVTDDAGRTYRKLLTAKGPLLGFALAPDGTSLHVGGPDDGLFAWDGRASEPTQTSKLKVHCLAREGDALWACSSEAGGFVAGVSHDRGTTFEPRLHLRDIGGPLACAEGTAVARECPGDWAKLQSELGLGNARASATASADAGAGAMASTRANGESAGSHRRAWMASVVALVVGAFFLLRARRRRR